MDVIDFANRYIAPMTLVADRIDELILEEHGDESLLVDRQEQAAWLKRAMAFYWGIHLPQPYIGFDLNEGLFIVSWQSSSECNVLTIDAKCHKGWYDSWPDDDNALLGEIDLDEMESWDRLRFAIITTRL